MLYFGLYVQLRRGSVAGYTTDESWAYGPKEGVEAFESITFFIRFIYAINFEHLLIFNGDKTRSSRQIHNVVTNTFSKYETRKIGLTLTYRFRKNVEKKKISSAETEMKRLQVNADE